MSMIDAIKSMMTGEEKHDAIAGQMLIDSYCASLGKVEAQEDVAKLIEYVMQTIIAEGMVKKAIVKMMIKQAEEDPERTDNTIYWLHLVLSEYYKERDEHQGCMCNECRESRNEAIQTLTEIETKNVTVTDSSVAA